MISAQAARRCRAHVKPGKDTRNSMAAGDLYGDLDPTMSNYLVKRYARRRPPAMGDLASTLATAADVASDPYLPEVICRIQQLKNIDHGEPVTVCAQTPDGIIGGGVGLHNAMIPLRAYVYAQQNTWAYALALAVVVGIPMWIGYELGKGSK